MGYLTDSALDLGALRGRLRPWTTGNYTAVTANYTILSTDGTVAVDTTGGAVTLTLPSAAANSGKTLRIIKTGGANVLTVQRAGSDTILPSSGTRTSVAFPSDCAMGEMLLCSNGSAWHVVSGQAFDETVGSRLYKWSQAKAATSTTAAVGWSLVSYDSGWRNIATLANTIPNLTLTKLNVWRTAARVEIGVSFTVASSSLGYSSLASLPPGFNPMSDGLGVGRSIHTANGSNALIRADSYMYCPASSSNLIVAAAAVGSHFAQWSVGTTATLPTSLPGTAA